MLLFAVVALVLVVDIGLVCDLIGLVCLDLVWFGDTLYFVFGFCLFGL